MCLLSALGLSALDKHQNLAQPHILRAGNKFTQQKKKKKKYVNATLTHTFMHQK